MYYRAAVSLLFVATRVQASLTGEQTGSSITTEEATNILRALTGEESLTANEATTILRKRATAMGRPVTAEEAAMQVHTMRSSTSEESLTAEESLAAEEMTNIMRSLANDETLLEDESLSTEEIMNALRALADQEQAAVSGMKMARTTQDERADELVEALEELTDLTENTNEIVSESKGGDAIDAESRAKDVLKDLNEAKTKSTSLETLVSFAKSSSFVSDDQQAICDAFSDLVSSQADLFNKLNSEEARLLAYQLPLDLLENILLSDEKIVDGVSEFVPTCKDSVKQSLETVQTAANEAIQAIS